MKYNSETLKAMVKIMSKLNPDETALLDKTPLAVRTLDEMNNEFGAPAFGVSYMNKKDIPVMESVDEYPIIPKLNYSNADRFGKESWITEPEIISHELGHTRDLSTVGTTSEPSAIAFENQVLGRSSGTPVSRRPLTEDLGLKRRVTPAFASRYFFRPGLALDDRGLSLAQRALIQSNQI